MSKTPVVWHGCYEESWKGIIVDAAFAHPAKMSRVLVRRIYDELFRLGALEPAGGSVVVDPFGGIGSTGLEGAYRNCVVICHELEPKFAALAGENFALHEAAWSKLRRPRPMILQGDSRKLRESLKKIEFYWDANVVVSSPPYAEIASGAGGLNTKPGKDGQQSGRSAASPSQDTDQRYGDAKGQLAKLPKGDVNEFIHKRLIPKHDDGIIESGPNHILTRETMSREEFCRRYPELCAAEFEGDVAAVVSSPPYVGGGHHPDQTGAWNANGRGQGADGEHAGYGRAHGQIGQMPAGAVEAVVSSPPYPQPYTGGGGINHTGYRKDGVVDDKIGERTYQARSGDRAAGNLETADMKGTVADVLVSSPPYSADGLGHSGANQASNDRGRKDIVPDAAKKFSKADLDGRDYGTTEGQLGHDTGETFWSAAKQIVAECYAVLKPGGYAVWVVKAFVRDKQIQDFPGDWRKLCEHLGFETVQEVHASLVAHYTENTLFDGEVAKKRERKSFFRRLHEKRSPETAIDFEVVYFMRKPL